MNISNFILKMIWILALLCEDKSRFSLFPDWIYSWSSFNYLILWQSCILNNCFLSFVLSSLVYSRVAVTSPSLWFTKVTESSSSSFFPRSVFHFLDNTHRSIESCFSLNHFLHGPLLPSVFYLNS